MAKIHENNWGSRFLSWLQHGSSHLDQDMMDEYDLTRDDYITLTGDEAEKVNDADLLLHERMVKVEKLEQELFARRYRKWERILYRVAAVAIAVAIIAILLNTVRYLPSFGHPDNPVNNEVSQRYIENGLQETGAVNIVAGMILDYRAFDTLGESNVLFTAACAVIILLRIAREKDESRTTEALVAEAEDRMYEPKNDIILQHIAKVLVPFILMFGMYVIMNGHISPGGGFSGGAVMGAGLILYLNAFGFKKTERFFTFTTFRIVSLCALTFYALSKTYSFFTGANHLHSIITPGIPGKLFSAGLIPYLNLAVGLVVCCTMYAFYTLFRKGDM